MSRSLRHCLLRWAAPAAVVAAAALLSPAASAAGYGDVTGKVVFDGEAPVLAPRIAQGASKTKDGQPVKDQPICAADAVPDFGLVVGEDNGIAHVFLYPTRPIRNVKPELKAPPKDPVVVDQQGCVFKPHALIVRTGQPMQLKSSDAAPHNVRFTSFGNPGLNLNVPPNGKIDKPVVFRRGQMVPIPALCDFHPWMKANWLIVDHPYAALTDETGEFKIEGLPAGKHTFTVWHESAGFLTRTLSVEVKENGVTEIAPLKYDLAAFKNLKQ